MEFKRTGSADFPDHLKVMVSGPPKSGKTTLLGTVPNIVIADTEPFANNLQSIAHKNIPYITVNGTNDLKDLLIVLRDPTLRAKAAESMGMPQIEAVAIDTLDTLQQIMKAERLKETRQTQFLRDDWAWLKEEMTAILRAFTALPLHVFFSVHVKTSEIGKGDDARMQVLPGLQGAIAEEIAGMVGYSLLAFRKQEIHPDGSPFTKYWLRAEGDETYAYLGNRAAGRLPDIIEPSFDAIYSAAMGGQVGVVLDGELTSATIDIPKPAEQPKANPDEAPVNAAALTHTKKVYDAIGFEFPEDIIKSLTLGNARELVMMWKACQQDEAEGKLDDDQTAISMMKIYLVSNGWVVSDDRLKLNQPTLDIKGSIDNILAYVEDSPERAQEAYDAETAKSSPRSSLIAALVERGAVPAAVEVPEVTEALAVDEPVEAPVDETSEPSAPETAEEKAVAVAQEVLGAAVIDGGEKVEPCEECGGEIDDMDIAVLSRSRFKRWLCVNDYIKQTKTASAQV
jgi:hypothetical protein